MNKQYTVCLFILIQRDRYILNIFFRYSVLLALSGMLLCMQANASVDSLEKHLEQKISQKDKVDILLSLADSYKVRSCNKFLELSENALSLARKSNYNTGLVKATIHLAEYQEDCKNEYATAVSEYKKAGVIARQRGLTNEEYDIYTGIARCYLNTADYQNELVYHQKALALPVANDDKLSVLANMGVCYKKMGRYLEAINSYQKAYQVLYEDMTTSGTPTDQDTLTLMGLQYEIGSIYKTIGDYNHALENFTSIKEYNEKLDHPFFYVLSELGFGECYLQQGNYQRSIQSFKNVVREQEKDERQLHSENYVIALQRLSDCYYLLGNIEKANDYALKALTIVESSSTQHEAGGMIPLVYISLGKIHKQKKEYGKAIGYLSKAIEKSRSSGMMEYEAEALHELSNVHERKGNTELALGLYKQYITLRDSMYSSEKMREMTRVDMQSSFDRQQFADSLIREEENAIARLNLQRQRTLTYTGFAVVALLLIFSFFVFRNFKREKHANKIISEARDTIREEKKRSEKLLHNILPEEVAEDLKERGATTAKRYDLVTVMFTDFVNFTKAGEQMGSEALVEELHTCFKAFDEIIDKYNIEKIKTIGDAYLAVSGLPVPDEQHAVNMILAAKEIAAFVEKRKKEKKNNSFDIRIGINSGSVVAGIVGVKKFAYDIWGDSVNIASRMESTSQPGRINITHSTYELVKDKFSCSYRGEIDAKHKGKLKMYFVEV